LLGFVKYKVAKIAKTKAFIKHKDNNNLKGLKNGKIKK
jgi:hypothetical protein